LRIGVARNTVPPTVAEESAVTAQSDRMPPIGETDQSSEQRAAAETFKTLRHQPIFGPFVPLHRSPDLMLRLAPVGDFMRNELVFGVRLAEIAILFTARRYDQPVEWAIHSEIAAKAGLPAHVIAALSEDRRPDDMTDDEALIWNAVAEIDRAKRLSDTTYAALSSRFGEKGVVELAALMGYYQLLATVMNCARTQAPVGPELPPVR
jgi:4-carboxymuconolactone decarboxylase